MPKPNNESESLKKSYSAYSIYLTMALKMGILIALGVYGGKYLDSYLQYKKPTYLIVGSLVGIGLGMWSAISDILKNAKPD